MTDSDLTTHYTSGLADFNDVFVPHLTGLLEALGSGMWSFRRHRAFAAGSDVDMMAHIIDATALRREVAIYPGDWYGFLVGSARPDRIRWTTHSGGRFACLCVPSVRNGHLTDEMMTYLREADACLLNINLYPTLDAHERATIAEALAPILEKSIVSVSFSRGFGMTASQLGVVLVPEGNEDFETFHRQWEWFTYFHNQFAARAFALIDHETLSAVDRSRRDWVADWLRENALPETGTGTYYVKSFAVEGDLPEHFRPLVRDDLVRLCFKPPIS